MRILRVFFSGVPGTARPWALFDDGRLVEHGHGKAPPADRVEAVLAADAVRVAALQLPPLPRSRVAAAAAYALEDRIAAPEHVAVVVGPQRDDGRVLAAVASRDTVEPLLHASPPFSRAIAEAELATPAQGWRWCQGERSAFVRMADGAAFAVSVPGDDALPPELAHALLQAAREGRAPEEVVADRRTSPEALAEWSRTTGVRFVAGTPWQWEHAPAASFANAIDLLEGLRRRDERPVERPRLTTALALLGAALALHVVATLATWGWTLLGVANAERDLVPIARAAGAASATPKSAAGDIARLHADARHRAGLAAPHDAMPVLARAAPAFAALPAGALKAATWSAGAWTVELAPLDEATLGDFVARLAGAGLVPLTARTASGIRARIAP